MKYQPDISVLSRRFLNRLLQGAIGAIFLVGLVTVNLSVIVNAGFAFAVTFLPAILKRDFRIQLKAWMTLWITGALFLHTLGMLGFYSDIWWYDHLTHTLSATIVATIGYVVTRAIDKWSDAIFLPSRFMFVYILLFTLALGVLWEVAEFLVQRLALLTGLEPVLIQYGLDDTLLDLLFDAFGALIVAAVGTQYVSHTVDSLADRLGEYRSDPDAHRVGEYEPGDTDAFEGFVNREPTNRRIAWAFTLFLLAVVLGGIAAGALLTSILVGTVVVLAVVPAVAHRNPRVMPPWSLLAIASLPVLGAVFGRPWLTSNIVTYVAVGTIALVIAVELHLFTDVRMTPIFAMVLVVVTTMAAAGVWAIGRWVADLYLGTELLLKPGYTDSQVETAMMWEFLHASVAGLLTGLVFELGYRRRNT
jgi:hypothetical protein